MIRGWGRTSKRVKNDNIYFERKRATLTFIGRTLKGTHSTRNQIKNKITFIVAQSFNINKLFHFLQKTIIVDISRNLI